ncbi:MAG: hypothetical protein KFB93_01445 [Simkaniaceae bacterium]|nr:MAG: hypothetical protein KFB93_01445 [Simkaniaceae bacterium]
MADFTIPYYGSKPHPAQYEPYGVLYYDASPDYEPPSYSAIMAASCPKVQAVCKEIVAKESEYEKCKWPHTIDLTNRAIFEGSEERMQRMGVEKDLLSLALKVKKLHQENARGIEHLREKICYLVDDVISAIKKDATHLDQYLEQRRKYTVEERRVRGLPDDRMDEDELERMNNREVFWNGETVTQASHLRGEYDLLVKRHKQVEAMYKTFERTDFTLSSGRVCSVNNGIGLRSDLARFKHKLPDSDFSRGARGFFGSIFGSKSKSCGSASYHPSTEANRAYTKSMERIINLQVQQSQIYQGWERVQAANRRW